MNEVKSLMMLNESVQITWRVRSWRSWTAGRPWHTRLSCCSPSRCPEKQKGKLQLLFSSSGFTGLTSLSLSTSTYFLLLQPVVVNQAAAVLWSGLCVCREIRILPLITAQSEKLWIRSILIYIYLLIQLKWINTKVDEESYSLSSPSPLSQPVSPSVPGSPSWDARSPAGPPWAGPPGSAGTPSSSSWTGRPTPGSLSSSAAASAPSSAPGGGGGEKRRVRV